MSDLEIGSDFWPAAKMPEEVLAARWWPDKENPGVWLATQPHGYADHVAGLGFGGRRQPQHLEGTFLLQLHLRHQPWKLL